jgi:predicted nucleotide-binding protein (sugar kinase/HSP70/actin superfamily)
MLDANSPEFLRRVDTLTKVVNKNIQMIDNDPVIVLATLFRLTAVTFVSERWPEHRQPLIGIAMHAMAEQVHDAYDKMEAVAAALPSNDEESQ